MKHKLSIRIDTGQKALEIHGEKIKEYVDTHVPKGYKDYTISWVQDHVRCAFARYANYGFLMRAPLEFVIALAFYAGTFEVYYDFLTDSTGEEKGEITKILAPTLSIIAFELTKIIDAKQEELASLMYHLATDYLYTADTK